MSVHAGVVSEAIVEPEVVEPIDVVFCPVVPGPTVVDDPVDVVPEVKLPVVLLDVVADVVGCPPSLTSPPTEPSPLSVSLPFSDPFFPPLDDSTHTPERHSSPLPHSPSGRHGQVSVPSAHSLLSPVVPSQAIPNQRTRAEA